MQALVTHVLGARPNFMKAAPVIRALGEAGVDQALIHTGQHYDARMSGVFFADLGLPEPDVNLHVGSGAHGEQTAAVIAGVERELMARRPALLVVYGDVNSTLGAALAAAKLHVPVAHVEAGLRSFDNTMPEEINRRLTDQLCELLFVTSPEAIGYLGREGIAADGVHFVGNTMIDTLVACLDKLDAEAARAEHGLPERYLVATLHRPFNVDSAEAAALLVKAMHQVADMAPVIMPVHPRGRADVRGGRAGGAPGHPDVRAARLPGVHVPGARRSRRDHGLGRGAGGDDVPAGAVPDPAPGNRAAGHRHQRQQPAGARRRTGVRRPGRPGPGPVRRGTAAAVGRRVRPPDRPHHCRMGG